MAKEKMEEKVDYTAPDFDIDETPMQEMPLQEVPKEEVKDVITFKNLVARDTIEIKCTGKETTYIKNVTKHLFSYEKSIILWIIKIFYVLLHPELLKKS